MAEYYNRDVEKQMEKLSLHKNDEKFKAVAGQLSKERKYELARNMKKIWSERRNLLRIGNQEEIEKWRSTLFFKDSSSESGAHSSSTLPSSSVPIDASGSGTSVDEFSESVDLSSVPSVLASDSVPPLSSL